MDSRLGKMCPSGQLKQIVSNNEVATSRVLFKFNRFTRENLTSHDMSIYARNLILALVYIIQCENGKPSGPVESPELYECLTFPGPVMAASTHTVIQTEPS